MLEITIKSLEQFNEKTNEFIKPKEQTIRLEHSLVSISKWESRWCKPFLSKDPKTYEETIDYIKCMTLTQNVDEDIYNYVSKENIKSINDYIESPMTAIRFMKDSNKGSSINEKITSEILYYDMIALNIPFECQKWHLNRLITLIKVCSIKSQPAKKMGRNEILSRNASLNAARRQKLKTKG